MLRKRKPLQQSNDNNDISITSALAKPIYANSDNKANIQMIIEDHSSGTTKLINQTNDLVNFEEINENDTQLKAKRATG